MIENYLPFAIMAVFTVASPGPGVLMTLDNALARGWRCSMHGVAGLALGAALMAALTTAGVGLLIRSSLPLFLLLKYAGIAYLFYLAYRAWHRTPQLAATPVPAGSAHPPGDGDAAWRLLARGVVLQTSNPKSLLFFLSVLPQVVDSHGDAASAALRLALAIATYCSALIVVHAVYAGLAARARSWLNRPSSARLIARSSAMAFAAFGIAMLSLKV